MNYEVTIDVRTDPDIIYEALKPEQSKFKRASWTVERKNDKTQIHVKADDAIALKAMLSTVIKALTLYEKAK